MNVHLQGLDKDSPDIFKVPLDILCEFGVINNMIEDSSEESNTIPLPNMSPDNFTLAIDVLLYEMPEYYNEDISDLFSPKNIESCTDEEIWDLIMFYDQYDNNKLLKLSYDMFAKKNFGKLPADFN
jgi:hypothetical protein